MILSRGVSTGCTILSYTSYTLTTFFKNVEYFTHILENFQCVEKSYHELIENNPNSKFCLHIMYVKNVTKI